ncbi:MAG: four helix bundle protein [Anaerolineaceae bacterium]
MQDFHKLKVWEKSHQLTLDIYRVTIEFPKEELYGLINQIRKSSASIATNIAEGCGRETNAELKRFLYIAMGSASETEYHLLLSKELGYLTESDFARLNQEIGSVKQMITSLIKKLKTDN